MRALRALYDHIRPALSSTASDYISREEKKETEIKIKIKIKIKIRLHLKHDTFPAVDPDPVYLSHKYTLNRATENVMSNSNYLDGIIEAHKGAKDRRWHGNKKTE